MHNIISTGHHAPRNVAHDWSTYYLARLHSTSTASSYAWYKEARHFWINLVQDAGILCWPLVWFRTPPPHTRLRPPKSGATSSLPIRGKKFTTYSRALHIYGCIPGPSAPHITLMHTTDANLFSDHRDPGTGTLGTTGYIEYGTAPAPWIMILR